MALQDPLEELKQQFTEVFGTSPTWDNTLLKQIKDNYPQFYPIIPKEHIWSYNELQWNNNLWNDDPWSNNIWN